MEIVWEDPPVPEGPFFTRDLYDAHSFAPNIRELWSFLQRPEETSPDKEVSATGGSLSKEDAQDQNDNIKEQFSWDSCEPVDVCTETKHCKNTNDGIKNNQEKAVPFPEPRVPYPCMSALSKAEQKTYLNFLTSHMKKKKNPPSQALLICVNNEVMQFMMYLQDVSRICFEDYKVIPQGALQYSEEFLQNSLEYMKTLPQLYQTHELTSLTGGTYNSGLTLTFEKQLLIMGSVDITAWVYKPVNSDALLASDYQSVSSQTPPAKKAKDMHASISSDSNAEKLCISYEPHVCMTKEALIRLLDNHGPDFREQWELPVLIKTNPSKVKGLKKTVFIDSPLLKTEVTVRERSHIYHEESLKLSVTKNGTRNVFHVMTELPVNEQPVLERCLVSFEDDSLDFEADLTDLETFGESTSNKATKIKKLEKKKNVAAKSEKTTCETKTKNSESSSLEEEMDTSKCGPVTSKATPVVKHETSETPRKSDQESVCCTPLTGDSDDEKLVIDDISPQINPEPKVPPTPDSDFSSPSRNTRSRRPVQREPKTSGDQLGEILQMQTAMFSSNVSDAAKSSNIPQDLSSPSVRTTSTYSHPTSLVKACVTSYLERNPNQEEETGDALPTAGPVKEHKKLLSLDLQAAAEDEHDYEAPEEGNILYKLYSLDDTLLMVRSSISFAHSKKVDDQNKYVPANILPKLEYQLSYGVECLTSSEACRLWTEKLLHSSTVSYIAHIDALTPRVAQIRKLQDNWIQNTSCGFKPSKSLNILQHLLKMLTGLDEGQYLLRHKAGEPFVNILKAANGKGRRGVYNLQQVHSGVPQSPASAPPPWIPVDPSVYLPFHRIHGRVPCTFPPKEFTQTLRAGTSQPHNSRGRQPGNLEPAKKKTKKKTKKKRAAQAKN